jgi:hypothetical protein
MVLKLSKNKRSGMIENVEVLGVVETALRFRGNPSIFEAYL